MKTLVPQHSSLPFACWKEERCAGAAAPRDCSPWLQWMAHVPSAATQEAAQGTLTPAAARGEREKQSLPLSLVALSAICCEDPSHRHLGAY